MRVRPDQELLKSSNTSRCLKMFAWGDQSSWRSQSRRSYNLGDFGFNFTNDAKKDESGVFLSFCIELSIKQTDVNKLIDKQLESPWDACSFLMLIVTCSPRLAFDLEHLEVWQVPRFGGSKLGRKSWCGWRDDRRMAHSLTGQTLVSWIYGMELCHIKLKFVTNKMYLLRYRVAKPYEVLPLVLRSASLLAFTSHRARAQHLGVLWL